MRMDMDMMIPTPSLSSSEENSAILGGIFFREVQGEGETGSGLQRSDGMLW